MWNTPDCTAFPSNAESGFKNRESSELPWRSWLGKRAEPKPKVRIDRSIGQTRDVDGKMWAILQRRPTKHAFDLLYGNPMTASGHYRGGIPRLIVTHELRAFWDLNRTKLDGFLFDLPAGRTTLKRARKRLGYDVRQARADFYRERMQDLATLRPAEFAIKHDVTKDLAFDWRLRLVGTCARPKGWWREPRVLEILRNSPTLAAAARQLGIGTSHVGRLRGRMAAEGL